MIAAVLQDWASRVLDQGRLGITVKDDWKLEAYEQYVARLRAPGYPCFFGQSAEARAEMLYTFVAQRGLDDMVTNMRKFVRLIAAAPHERSSLIAFFEPDRTMTDHMSFTARFWHVLAETPKTADKRMPSRAVHATLSQVFKDGRLGCCQKTFP